MEKMYECSACLCIFNDLQELSTHLNVHKKSYSGSYVCPMCEYQQKSIGAFQKHLKRFHLTHKPSETETFTCKICGTEIISKEILSHHGGHFDGIVQIGCPFDECESKFLNRNSFKVHVARKHRNGTSHRLDVIPNETSSKSQSVGEAPVEVSDNNKKMTGKTIEDFNNAALIFYMKLEFELLIPSSSVQYIS